MTCQHVHRTHALSQVARHWLHQGVYAIRTSMSIRRAKTQSAATLLNVVMTRDGNDCAVCIWQPILSASTHIACILGRCASQQMSITSLRDALAAMIERPTFKRYAIRATAIRRRVRTEVMGMPRHNKVVGMAVQISGAFRPMTAAPVVFTHARNGTNFHSLMELSVMCGAE